MTRDHRLDRLVRRLSRVTDDQVARQAGTAAREALLEGIVTMPVPVPSHRRALRPLGVGLGAVAFAGTAAFGWALTRSDPRQTGAVQCSLPGSELIVPSSSGDPVVDCAAEWLRETGSEPPALVAYDNGHGGIVVVPATAPVPRGATALPPGRVQDVALIELRDALDDYVAGLPAACHDTAAATAIADAQLARLRLTGWTVRPPATPGGCVSFAVVLPPARTVELRATPNLPPGNEPFRMLATQLRPIARECLPLAVARRRVEVAAKDLGLDGATGYRPAAVPDPRRCTTIHETVGGAIFLTLRGPTR